MPNENRRTFNRERATPSRGHPFPAHGIRIQIPTMLIVVSSPGFIFFCALCTPLTHAQSSCELQRHDILSSLKVDWFASSLRKVFSICKPHRQWGLNTGQVGTHRRPLNSYWFLLCVFETYVVSCVQVWDSHFERLLTLPSKWNAPLLRFSFFIFIVGQILLRHSLPGIILLCQKIEKVLEKGWGHIKRVQGTNQKGLPVAKLKQFVQEN